MRWTVQQVRQTIVQSTGNGDDIGGITPVPSSLYSAQDALRFVLRSPGLQAPRRRFDPLPSHSSPRWTGPGGRLTSGTQTEVQGLFSKHCVSSVFLHLEPSLNSSAVIKV